MEAGNSVFKRSPSSFGSLDLPSVDTSRLFDLELRKGSKLES